MNLDPAIQDPAFDHFRTKQTSRIQPRREDECGLLCLDGRTRLHFKVWRDPSEPE